MEMLHSWSGGIQVYTSVEIRRLHQALCYNFCACFKEEKKSPSPREKVLRSLEPDLTVLGLRLDTVLLCDLRQVMLPLCALLPHCG